MRHVRIVLVMVRMLKDKHPNSTLQYQVCASGSINCLTWRAILRHWPSHCCVIAYGYDDWSQQPGATPTGKRQPAGGPLQQIWLEVLTNAGHSGRFGPITPASS